MSKTVVLTNPDAATTIGASLQFSRVAAGATGVNIVYNPNNGDTPFETTIAAALSAGARTNLAAILVEIDTFMKSQRGYS